MAPIYTVPVPPGPLRVALKGGEDPIVLKIDDSSPLAKTPIKPGFLLVALKLSSGVVISELTTKEMIIALDESKRDPDRRLTFQAGNFLRDSRQRRPVVNEVDDEVYEGESPSLEYWDNHDISAWFQYYDADGSGELSQEEVIDALVDTFDIPQKRKAITAVVKKYWPANDLDGSGYVDMDEFCDPKGYGAKIKKVIHVAIGKKSPSTKKKDIPENPSLQFWEENTLEWFHYYDADNSNSLTQEELIDALVDTFCIPQRRPSLTAFVKKYWTKNDHDQNGMITEDEFCDPNGFGEKLKKVIHTIVEKRSKEELEAKPTLEYWNDSDAMEWFEYYDKDQSNSLSQQEVIDGFIDTFGVPQKRAKVTAAIKKYWSTNDMNQDGSISEEEFCDDKGFGKKLKTVIQKKVDQMKQAEADKKVPTMPPQRSWSIDLNVWFDYYDKDKSSTLSKSEVTAALIDTLSITDRVKKVVVKAATLMAWSKYDLDKNGVVDKEEFVAPGGLADTLKAQLEKKNSKGKTEPAKPVQQYGPEKAPIEYWETHTLKWFHYYDHDNSNSLSKEELIDALVDTFGIPQRRPNLTAFVNKYWTKNDHDQNGMITEDEFCDPNGFGEKLKKVIHTIVEKRSKEEVEAKPTLEDWNDNDVIDWFIYYDKDQSHSLSQQEVIDGFIDTFGVPQNRAKVTSVIKKYWSTNDMNHDGSISEAEFCDDRGFGKKLKTIIQKKVDKMKQAEKHVSFADKPEIIPPRKSWSIDLNAWFDYYDKDKSSTLSKSEVTAALIDTLSITDRVKKVVVKAATLVAWSQYDLDKNGLVDKDEFVAPGGLADAIKAQLAGTTRRASPVKAKPAKPAFVYDERSNSIKVPVPAGSIGIAIKSGPYPILVKIEDSSPLKDTPVKIGWILKSVKLGNNVSYSKFDTDQAIDLLHTSSNDPGRSLVFSGGPYTKVTWS